MNKWNVGDPIFVRLYGGEVVERVVARLTDLGEPLICTYEEDNLAMDERREPNVVGWPREYIVDPDGNQLEAPDA